MMNTTVMEHVQREAASYIRKLQEGKPAVEIAAEMYCQNLPGKSEQTAMMMAQHTADTVEGYYRSKTAALEDYDHWANTFFTAATACMSDVDAYNQLHQIYVGTVAAAEWNHAATAEEKQAIQSWVEEEVNRSFAAQEVTPETLDQLKTKLADALKESGLLTTQLDAVLETIRSQDANARMLLDFGTINQDVMTLLAMQTYLDAKNGLIPEIPTNARLEDIALSACAAMDTYHVAAQVARGEISAEEGLKLLGILGGILGSLLAGGMIGYVSVAMAAAVFSLLGSIPLAVVAGIVVLVAMIEPVSNALIEAGIQVGNVTQTVAVTATNLLVKGVSMLIGAVARGIETLRTKIKARKEELSAEPQAQTETEQQAAPVRQTAEVLA